MAFEQIIPEEEQVAKVIATEDIYRTNEGKLVPAGPDARVLVAKIGREIHPKFEEQVTPGGKIKTKKKPAVKKPATKKARKPAANKSRKQGDNK